jgi:hypothetical protein
MTGTNCGLFTHKSSRSYLNHLVLYFNEFLILVYRLSENLGVPPIRVGIGKKQYCCVC